jgi:hypothetical protein
MKNKILVKYLNDIKNPKIYSQSVPNIETNKMHKSSAHL